MYVASVALVDFMEEDYSKIYEEGKVVMLKLLLPL